MLMTVATGFCIVVVNAVIKQIFITLTKFQRFKSLTIQSETMQMNYFLALFINTALVPIIANANVFGLQFTEKLVEMFVSNPSTM